MALARRVLTREMYCKARHVAVISGVIDVTQVFFSTLRRLHPESHQKRPLKEGIGQKVNSRRRE